MEYSSELKNEKISMCQTNRSLKFQDKLKVEHYISEKYVDSYYSTKPNANKKPSENRQKNWVKSKSMNDEELVKHMSNVPGYLQGIDRRGENVQENALNFGVLNWENLEKWKYNQKPVPAKKITESSLPSSSSSISDLIHRDAQAHKIKKNNRSCSRDFSHGDKSWKEKVMDSRGKIPSSDKYFETKSSEKMHGKGKFNDLDEKFTTKMGNSVYPKTMMSSKVSESVRKIEDSLGSEIRNKNLSEKSKINISETGNSSRNMKSYRTPIKSKEKIISLGVSQLSTPRTSIDSKNSEKKQNCFSEAFSSDMLQTADSYAEIPRSCPLPSTDKANTKPSNSSDYVKTVGRIIAELKDKKSRNPSPNGRISTGLGRMSRSLSFKEGSLAPQLGSTYVSVKSGPLIPESFNSRTKSSPLRRLLDPLLKPKASIQHRSVEISFPIKMDLNSVNHTTESTVHALLQFTVKNGLSLFKFVVENNSNNIFAATIKTPGQFGKDDSVNQSYVLYSVHEIKKKNSRWINQGNKEKSCGYEYNIAAQMKVCTHLTGNKFEKFPIKEFKLYSVDVKHINQESAKVVPNRELAAIVMKNSNNNNGKNKCSKNFGEDKNMGSFCTVVLPHGVHGLPNKGAPSPLLDRWRSGGSCDCGGWDLGCRICVLSSRDFCDDFSDGSTTCSDRFQLFIQGGEDEEQTPYFSMAPFKKDIYSVEFKSSISLLQAFFICVAVKTGMNLSDNIILEMNQYVNKPPVSPIGRV